MQNAIQPGQTGYFGDGCAQENDGKGRTIQALMGTVVQIDNARTTKSGKTMQKIVLAGEDGQQCKVVLMDRQPLDAAWNGHKAMIMSKSTQYGLNGVYLRDEDYQNIQSRIVWVTKSAEIVQADSFTSGTPNVAQSPQPAAPPRQAPPQAPQAASQPPQAPRANNAPPQRQNAPQAQYGGNSGVPEMKRIEKRFAKRAYVMKRAIEAAYHFVQFSDESGIVMSPEDLTKIAISMVIDEQKSMNLDAIVIPSEGSASKAQAPQATQAPVSRPTAPPAQAPAPTHADVPQTLSGDDIDDDDILF